MSSGRVYFKGLHGLRFIAASLVIITHIEIFKARHGIENLYNINKVIKNFGVYGVDFFFVLSGFLISYLLFKEKDKFGFINLKHFYIRRILRIWPLYYFIVVLVFIILPLINFPSVPGYSLEGDFFERLILCLLFLPNASKSFFDFIPYGGILWSVGVEEQFYLLWPVLLKYSKNYFKTIIWVIVVFVLLKIVFLLPFFNKFNHIDSFRTFLAMTRIELMAIGGLGALVVYSKSYDKLILNKWILNGSLLFLIMIIMFLPKALNNLLHLCLSIPFILIIINVAMNKTMFSLENKMFKFLGNISYGLYMFHMTVAGGIIYLAMELGLTSLTFNIFVYVCTFVVTILISHYSFILLEKPFLKLKSKFAVIQSGLKVK